MSSPQTAVDLALIIIRNGGTTLAAERAFLNVMSALGRTGTVIWRYDVLVACGNTKEDDWEMIRSIDSMGLHLGRVSAAVALSERVASGQVHWRDLGEELAHIEKLKAPVGPLMVSLAAACAGFSIAQTAGGDWKAALLAFVAAGLGQELKNRLSENLGKSISTSICAGLSTLLAFGGISLGWSESLAPTVIGSVVYLVPGISLINGFVDVTSGKHLQMGIERITNAICIFLLIGIAIAISDALVR